jgi:hypothetical protein
MPVFTAETARSAGRLSGSSRREFARTVKEIAITLRSDPVQRKPTLTNGDLTHTPNQDLELVEEQIQRARAVLNDMRCNWCPACERSGVEPHHRAQLMKAIDSLLHRKAMILGIHLPGPSKAPRESNRRSPVIVLPQESLDPGPVQPVKPVEAEPSKYWDYEGC